MRERSELSVAQPSVTEPSVTEPSAGGAYGTEHADRRALQRAARQFADAHLAPFAAERDAEHIFPIDTLRAAGALGLGGIYVEEDVGGSALSRRDAVGIFEELARGDTTVAAYISIHNMVAWMIDDFGDDAQRNRWLPNLCSMQSLASYCLTEPDAGSDAASLVTRARREGDEYVVSGVKQFISGAGATDVYAVMVCTGESGARGISALIIESGTPGLSFGPLEHKMGWNAQPTRQVILDEVRVPVSNRLGAECDGCLIRGGKHRAAIAWRVRLPAGLWCRTSRARPSSTPNS